METVIEQVFWLSLQDYVVFGAFNKPIGSLTAIMLDISLVVSFVGSSHMAKALTWSNSNLIVV